MGKTVRMIAINDLIPYANNARKHSEEQIEKLRTSLREFGFVNPCLVDGHNNVIAGHGRIEAAQLEGMKEVPCVLVEHLTDEQRRAYILADNRLAELAEWDIDTLQDELQSMIVEGMDIDLTGFSFEDAYGGAKTQPKKENLEPYAKAHILVSCDADKIADVLEHVNKIKDMEGVEIDHAFN